MSRKIVSGGFTQRGAGAVWRRNADKFRESVSVLDFGAVGNGIADDTAAIVAAIAAVSALGGGEVRIPPGTYKTTANIDVPSNVSICGSNRTACVVNGGDQSHVGFTFTGNTSEVRDIFIRGMSIGVAGGAGRYCKVFRCVVSYNRIGIDWNNGFINTIQSSNVTFNTYGIVVRGQSFQMNIYDNVIDNNLGGLGLLMVGTNGAIVRDNTIEGARNDAADNKRGVGMFIGGFNQRLVVESNWFEQNGVAAVTSACADIIVGVPNVADVTDIVANCIPAEYQNLLAPGSVVTGSISISKNFHYATKHGIITPSGGTTCTISIEKETFVGLSGAANKAIRIVGQGAGGKVRILAPQVVNTAQASVNAEMNVGVLGSCVFFEGAAASVNQVTLDGVDLFTKRMTAAEFLALPGATLTCTARIPTSGTASMQSGARAVQGTSGVTTVAGTGRLRLGAAGVLTVGAQFRAILIAKAGGQGNFSYAGGGASFAACVGNNGKLFAVSTGAAPTSAEVTLSSGEYYGYCFLSEADYATYMSGALRIEITDLQIVTDRTVGVAAPSSALTNGSVGDIVWNSAPASGGYIGWVCTAAGSPGTWKPFGAIA